MPNQHKQRTCENGETRLAAAATLDKGDRLFLDGTAGALVCTCFQTRRFAFMRAVPHGFAVYHNAKQVNAGSQVKKRQGLLRSCPVFPGICQGFQADGDDYKRKYYI